MATLRSGLLLLLAALVLLSAGCRHRPPPALVRIIQTAPAGGEASPEDLRGGLRVVFDRAVAPAGSLGTPLAAGLRLSPATPGESRWLDDHTLVFFVAGGLRPSTRYTVTLAPDLRLGPDLELGPWSGLTFVHDRVRLDEVGFAGPARFQPRTPVATLRSSVAVAGERAAAGCAFVAADGSRVAARASDPGAVGRVVRLGPVRPLPPGAEFVLRCGAGFRPPGDSVGLSQDHDSRLATYGPAAVKSFAPAGNDVSADDVKVQIVFATPMKPDAVRQRVTLSDAEGVARPLELAGDALLTTFSWSGDLTPGAEYDLVVGPGLSDAFGQPLTGEQRHHFKVGDGAPRLQVQRGIYVVEKASGRYPVWARNLSGFHVRCTVIPESRLTQVLTGPASYDAWGGSTDGDVDYQGLRLTPRERDVDTRAPRNRWFDAGLALGPTCGGGPSGVYYLELTSPEVDRGAGAWRPRHSLATVTDLGLLAKVGNASSLVWVVRLSTGKPVSGAVVKIRDLAGKVRFSGPTSADGVVQAPGAARLLGLTPRPSTADGGEGDEDWEDYRARRVIVTARDGEDLAVLDTNWNNGIQIWNFGVSPDRRGGQRRVRGFLHSDRGLYRPGETVHLHGLARAVDLGGSMAIPRGQKIHVVVTDPRGASVLDEEVTLTRFGGFSRDLTLPAEARLGDWRVAGELEGQRFSERFSVEEYRPRSFEVKVTTPRPDVYLGQPLTFAVEASYLYGASLGGAKVTWNLRRRPRLPRFPGFAEYAFQILATLYDQGRSWSRSEERSFSDAVADGAARLDRDGRLAVEARDEVAGVTGPQDYLFSVTVEDESGQGVTATQAVGAHQANLYLGLHPAECVQAVDMPFAVQLVGFDSHGRRRPARVDLSISRRHFECGPAGCTPRDQAPAIRRAVAVPEAGSAAVERVVLKEPGEYLVSATGPDGRGGVATTSDLIYVIGEGEAFWSGDEGDRMTVIASRPSYHPGETARLVPQAQLAGALALVTLERDGILSYRVQSLASSGQALEVKIEGRHAPNVFASVVLARGRTGPGDKGRPRFKMGLVDLAVDTGDQRLDVKVETDRASYRPGDPVKARFKVTTMAGAPVRAELTVSVADEGVLQIVGFKTPDPLPILYASWGLGVETATTWNRLLAERDPDDQDDGEEGGDSGGDEAGRIRSRFMASAFWAPALVTSAAGEATVTFTAPDNLTAFRVMAVAATTDRFGAGERRMTVNKPLQATPALPRFLTVGDQAQAAVLVHNNLATSAEVTVRLTARGVEAPGEPTRTLKLGPRSQVRVAFPIVAQEPGRAAFTFQVSGGGQRDAVEITLPVSRPAVEEVVVLGEGSTTSRVQYPQPDRLPAGHLEVTFDRTGLAGLAAGLRYLVGYPHGCLEQTTSKVIPMVALGELGQTIELEGVSAADTRRFVEAGVGKILRHQHDDGGFGLWPGSPPEVHYTAYALWGLEIARAAGYQVDPAAMLRGAGYLKGRLGAHPAAGASAAEEQGEAGNEAWSLYVLATLGQADAGRLSAAFERRQRLPIYARAYLARALQKAGQTGPAATLAGELAAQLPGGGGPVVLREGEDLPWYWSSNVRSTALVLSALLEIAPRQPAIPRLARGLLEARVDQRWETTQDNVNSLLALAALARARTGAGPVEATITWGKSTVHRTVPARGAQRLSLPLGEPGPLTIASAGGELFYATSLHLDRSWDPSPAAHGLAVERRYLDPATGQPLTRLRLGQVVKVVLQVQADVRLSHVAVVDRLPAGLEPVLQRFTPSLEREPDERDWRSPWWGRSETAWQNQELHDDRVALFADVLAAGQSQREYLARATAVGTFATPPATAEAMYRPRVNGRSASTTLEVVP